MRLIPLVLLIACHPEEPPGPDCRPRLTASGPSLRADGADTLVVTAPMGDECEGEPTLTTTRGTLSAPTRTLDRWEWTLQAGNVPGTAVVTLSLPGEDAIAREIPLLDGAPLAVQLHQHGPLSEGDTTHAYQTREAEQHGVDVIVWADHDYRYWYDFYTTPEWTLGDVLVTEEPADGDRAAWWTIRPGADLGLTAALDDAEPLDDAPSLHLQATSTSTATGHKWGSVAWNTRGRRLYRPLFADVTVRFALKPAADWDPTRHGVRVVLPLSQVEPEDFPEIVLVSEDDRGIPSDDPRRVTMPPLVPGEWNEVELDVSAWADANLPDGRDATLLGFEVWVGATAGEQADVRVGGIEVAHAVCCDDLVQRQRDLLDERLSATVTHWVGQELTYETDDVTHFVAVGDRLPWADYERWSLLTEPHEIVADAQEQGGAVIYAHPFGVSRSILDTGDPEALVSGRCDQLDRAGLFGADAVEIGYPSRVRPLEDHLALWDCLLDRHELATGVGTSDQHVTKSWDTYENNFVTWVIGFDDADGLLDGLRSGRAFFGDPTHLQHNVRVEIGVPDVAVMGQVAIVPAEPIRVEVQAKGLGEKDTITVLVDGVAVLEGASAADAAVDVTPDDWTVVRAEVRDAGGVVRLVTNPIVLTTDAEPDVPAHRIARP